MPSTAEGKEIVSANGLAHGLAARKFALIPGESQDEFDARQLDLLAQWEPASAKEEEVVKRIAVAEWKLNRADNLETECFTEAMEAENCTFSQAFDKVQDKLKRIMRYQGSLRSEYNKAIALLLRIQEGRKRNEKNEAIAECKRSEASVHDYMAGSEAMVTQLCANHLTQKNEANSTAGPPEPQSTPQPAPQEPKPRPAWLKKPPKMRF
jgi:hypothetical protein